MGMGMGMNVTAQSSPNGQPVFIAKLPLNKLI